MKRILSALLVLLLLPAFTVGCRSSSDTEKQFGASKTVSLTVTVSEDTKYGSAVLSLTPAELDEAGIHLGDSCDISFTNGYAVEDVPYYNGYYVRNGAPVIVAYPGFNDVRITYNNKGIWESASLHDGDKVTLTLNESGKYAAVQESLGQVYSFAREDYDSDEQFCNYRALSGGNLKENFLYRGASPFDNSRGRAAYTDSLLEKTGIRFIVDLADSEEDMAGYLADATFASDYGRSLYEGGHAVLLDMSSSFQSQDYKEKVVRGLRAMTEADGPVYIHCMEGKDRTGFVCILLEALAGASYEEMRSDYMKTYENYFRVSPEKTPEKYDAIVNLYFDANLEFNECLSMMLSGGASGLLQMSGYAEEAETYLLSGGMTAEEIAALRAFITAPSAAQ